MFICLNVYITTRDILDDENEEYNNYIINTAAEYGHLKFLEWVTKLHRLSCNKFSCYRRSLIMPQISNRKTKRNRGIGSTKLIQNNNKTFTKLYDI